MPYCPECREEYIRSIEICVTCQIPLVEELPTTPHETTPDGARAYLQARTPIAIMRSTLEPCREIRDHLLEHRVPCAIEEAQESYATDVPSVHLRFDVMVAEEDMARVQEVMSDRYSELLHNEGVEAGEATVTIEPGSEVTCPACGTQFKVEGDECPDCGLFIGV